MLNGLASYVFTHTPGKRIGRGTLELDLSIRHLICDQVKFLADWRNLRLVHPQKRFHVSSPLVSSSWPVQISFVNKC